MIENNLQQQKQSRSASLTSPIYFDVAVGTGSTALYTGKDDRYFMIRGLMAVNTTAAGIALTVTGDGNTWYAATVLANSSGRIDELEGLLIDPSVDLAASGAATGVRIVGWGVRVFGGDTWVL